MRISDWSSDVCSSDLVTDECGAPARFTGATIIPVAHDDGKLSPDAIDPYVQWLGSEHHPQPAAVSITQSTEMGTLYTVDEIAAVCDKAHAAGLRSEEHTSELQSLMRNSYDVFCLNKKK